MQEIINKYDTQGSPYLLPIIRDMEVDGRKQYKKTAHLVNQKLKKLGMRLGLSIPLTTYVARHAWASIAKSKNISLSVMMKQSDNNGEESLIFVEFDCNCLIYSSIYDRAGLG